MNIVFDLCELAKWPSEIIVPTERPITDKGLDVALLGQGLSDRQPE